MEKFQNALRAGPVADQPSRLRTPPGVGTPLQAAGLPGQRHPLGKSLLTTETNSKKRGPAAFSEFLSPASHPPHRNLAVVPHS
jgi:hypothetical protein